MTDLVKSIIRTIASKVAGAVIGLALAVGVVVPAALSDQLQAALTTALVLGSGIVWYVAVRVLEQHYPAIGRLLLLAQPPAYGDQVPIYTHLVIDHERTEPVLAELHRSIRLRTGRPTR